MRNRIFRISGPDVIHEMFDEDLVVVDLSSGRYYGFNGAAATIWETVLAGATQSEIASNLPDDVGVVAFLDRLIDFGLLAEDNTDRKPDQISTKTQAILAKSKEQPEVTVYDDLSDLIVADPIHDASTEEGWPVRDPAVV